MAETYQVKTEIFSGPIELLLYLARKNEIDIFDVPLAQITDDYLNYLQQVQSINIEISSDFLLMAAVLIRFKIWRLLPKTQDAEQIPETVSLDDIIEEFKKYAGIVGYLSELEMKRLQLFPRRAQILEEMPEAAGDISVLISAFRKILERNTPKVSLEIPVPEIRLEDKLSELRQLLIQKVKLNFNEIASQTKSILEIIIMFIALLELIRLGEVVVRQDREFGEILLEKRVAGNAASI
ncbi:MAG: segregation/condensation protein A [candidate division WOR-3 bacterium]|nr:segregation/condensation protein A [candidate division WOR-3 bacterium]